MFKYQLLDLLLVLQWEHLDLLEMDTLLAVAVVVMVVIGQQEQVVLVEEGNQVLTVQELQKVKVFLVLITLAVAVVLVQDSLTVLEEMVDLELLYFVIEQHNKTN